jgi:hypothetical protein
VPSQQPAQLGPPLARCLRHHRFPMPSRHLAARCPYSEASLLTWQYASAFNQPLSLDTSSVTSMGSMFYVCAPRLPCHQPPQLGLLARCLRRRRFRFLCFPFDTAGRVGVQPAPGPQHVQRHNHGAHISGVRSAVPCQQPPQLGPCTPPPLLRALQPSTLPLF